VIDVIGPGLDPKNIVDALFPYQAELPLLPLVKIPTVGRDAFFGSSAESVGKF
jgi:hypothetical protein